MIPLDTWYLNYRTRASPHLLEPLLKFGSIMRDSAMSSSSDMLS